MNREISYPYSKVAYYAARCGSCYLVTTSQTHRAAPVQVWQAKRAPDACGFSPGYLTTSEEVARLVKIGAFVSVPPPLLPAT